MICCKIVRRIRAETVSNMFLSNASLFPDKVTGESLQVQSYANLWDTRLMGHFPDFFGPPTYGTFEIICKNGGNT